MSRRKKRKLEDPILNKWEQIHILSKNISMLIKKINNYKSLLAQMGTITMRDQLLNISLDNEMWRSNSFDFTETSQQNIKSFIQSWIQEFIKKIKKIERNKLKAIENLKKSVKDDQPLQTISDYSQKVSSLETLYTHMIKQMDKWKKIVRAEKDSSYEDVQQHTTIWINRWMSTWDKDHNDLVNYKTSFKSVLEILRI